MTETDNQKRYFFKLKPLGNGLALYFNKKIMKHLRLYKDSDICVTLNKNRTITVSKATYSDRLIEQIVEQLVNLD